MQTDLLQRAREGRLAALDSLARFKEDNIFLLDSEYRRSRPAHKVQFTSARTTAATHSDPANRPAAPQIRLAA